MQILIVKSVLIVIIIILKIARKEEMVIYQSNHGNFNINKPSTINITK